MITEKEVLNPWGQPYNYYRIILFVKCVDITLLFSWASKFCEFHALLFVHCPEDQTAEDKEKDDNRNTHALGIKDFSQEPQKEGSHKGCKFSRKGEKAVELVFL